MFYSCLAFFGIVIAFVHITASTPFNGLRNTTTMETKKNVRANLERKKFNFLLIGLVFSLSATLMAFEYSVKSGIEPTTYTLPGIDLIETEIMPIHLIPEPIVETPVEKVKPISTEIEIVKDLVERFEGKDEPIVEPLDVYTLPSVFVAEEKIAEDSIFIGVEEMPSFPGGDNALLSFLGKNINYPQMAADAGIMGMVYVSFVVDKSGNVNNIRVLKGIGGGCDEEAIRVLKQMPKWSPGKQRGKAVNVHFNLPIKFRLQ